MTAVLDDALVCLPWNQSHPDQVLVAKTVGRLAALLTYRGEPAMAAEQMAVVPPSSKVTARWARGQWHPRDADATMEAVRTYEQGLERRSQVPEQGHPAVARRPAAAGTDARVLRGASPAARSSATPEERAAGLGQQARDLARAVHSARLAGDALRASRLRLLVPPGYEHLAEAETAVLASRAHDEHHVPRTIKEYRRIAAHRQHRTTLADRRPAPGDPESVRRARCPHPRKVAYEDTATGRAAASWHVTELSYFSYGNAVLTTSYQCSCQWWHVGNRSAAPLS